MKHKMTNWLIRLCSLCMFLPYVVIRQRVQELTTLLTVTLRCAVDKLLVARPTKVLFISYIQQSCTVFHGVYVESNQADGKSRFEITVCDRKAQSQQTVFACSPFKASDAIPLCGGDSFLGFAHSSETMSPFCHSLQCGFTFNLI